MGWLILISRLPSFNFHPTRSNPDIYQNHPVDVHPTLCNQPINYSTNQVYLPNLLIMTILVKQARIVCTGSPYHGQTVDILVVDGNLSKISPAIDAQADRIISYPGLHVSIGWFDLFAHFGDPGLEHKETLETGASAAAAGGFTDVLLVPNTQPALFSKSQIEYVVNKGLSLPVSIHPMGCITRQAEGKELAEMYDMHHSGALAFSDGTQPVQKAGMLSKALQYVKTTGSPVIQVPDEQSLSVNGLINEGITSTRLGLPGKPALAEELMIARDIELLRYTGSTLHITGISTRKAVELIRAAKKEGLNLTASVTPYHLRFTEEDLGTYDTNLKVNPPLRTADDVAALREAINDGSIDCIASHHLPQHWDDKTCEFEYAKYGATGLESLFGAARPLFKDLNLFIDMLTKAPRQILRLPVPDIREGEKACLTLFAPDESYTFTDTMRRSKSANNPFTGKQLTGKPLGIIHKNQTTFTVS